MEIHNMDPSKPSISFCNIEGGYEGEGNFNQEPLFLDKDLRLSAESPCIDNGNNDALPKELKTDLDLKARVVNNMVDLGPYEFQK
jgi:hypothetical protein